MAESDAEFEVAHQTAPDWIIVCLVWIERDVAAGAVGPKVGLVAAFSLTFLQDRCVREGKPSRLQVRLAPVHFRRDQATSRDRKFDRVNIRQLSSFAVDPMIVRIAFQDVARVVLLRRIHPGLQSRQIWIIEFVHVVVFVVQWRPTARLALSDMLFQLIRVGEIGMVLLHEMRWPVDKGRAGRRQCRQKAWVGRGPTVAHGRLIQNFENRRLTINQHQLRRAARREFRVIRDIFPPIPKIFRSERRAVGPFMALAQVQGVDPAVFDLDAFQNVGLQFEVFVVTNQPSIAIDDHVAYVFRPADQHFDLTAMFADRAAPAFKIDDQWFFRNTFFNRRHQFFNHAMGEKQRLFHRDVDSFDRRRHE